MLSPSFDIVPPKNSTQTISLAPGNGSFPRNVRPILPNIPDEQLFRLRWEQHVPNQQAMFTTLLERGTFCDVALACEEKLINVHKLVLSSCSSYFESILTRFDKRDPVIVLKDIKYETMLALVHFIYKGEVCLDQSQLSEVLDAAHALKIKGLSEDVHDNRRNCSPGSAANNSFVTKANGSQAQVESNRPPLNHLKKPRGRGRPKKEIAESPLRPEVAVEEEEVVVKKRKRSSVGRPRKEQPPTPAAAVEDPLDVTAAEDNDEAARDDQQDIEVMIDNAASRRKQSLTPRTRPRREAEETPNVAQDTQSNSAAASATHSPPASAVPDAPQAGSGEVVQLEAYMRQGGTNIRFWSERWVTDTMDAIKRKELSLQDGAKCLGVKYQSLYGRYRVHHGYLITRKDESKKRRGEPQTESDADTSSLKGMDYEEVSASADCERNNEWDPSLNLEPLVQIDSTDGDHEKDSSESADQADVGSVGQSRDATENHQVHDGNAILGL